MRGGVAQAGNRQSVTSSNLKRCAVSTSFNSSRSKRPGTKVRFATLAANNPGLPSTRGSTAIDCDGDIDDQTLGSNICPSKERTWKIQDDHKPHQAESMSSNTQIQGGFLERGDAYHLSTAMAVGSDIGLEGLFSPPCPAPLHSEMDANSAGGGSLPNPSDALWLGGQPLVGSQDVLACEKLVEPETNTLCLVGGRHPDSGQDKGGNADTQLPPGTTTHQTGASGELGEVHAGAATGGAVPRPQAQLQGEPLNPRGREATEGV